MKGALIYVGIMLTALAFSLLLAGCSGPEDAEGPAGTKYPCEPIGYVEGENSYHYICQTQIADQTCWVTDEQDSGGIHCFVAKDEQDAASDTTSDPEDSNEPAS